MLGFAVYSVMRQWRSHGRLAREPDVLVSLFLYNLRKFWHFLNLKYKMTECTMIVRKVSNCGSRVITYIIININFDIQLWCVKCYSFIQILIYVRYFFSVTLRLKITVFCIDRRFWENEASFLWNCARKLIMSPWGHIGKSLLSYFMTIYI